MKINLTTFQKDPHQHWVGIIDNFSQDSKMINNPLIKKIEKVNYDLNVTFTAQNSNLKIIGTMAFILEAIDAIDGQVFIYSQELSWDDSYQFGEILQSDANFIIGENFNLVSYLVEQINLNIPLNLSKNHDIISKVGSGWELLSETDYQIKKQQSNDSDPRWDELDQWKNK